MSANRHELRDDPSIDFQNHCIECGDEALDHCQSCGAPLCSRHHETGGGFCGDFTSVATDLGQLPACIRRVGDEVDVTTNTSLLYGQEDLPAPEDVTRDELEDAVRAALPEAVLEAAADHLADVAVATHDNQILGQSWAMHIALKQMASSKREPEPEADALETMVEAIDDLLRRVERSADDSSDVEIANDFSIGTDLGLARDEIERVRGTEMVEGGESA